MKLANEIFRLEENEIDLNAIADDIDKKVGFPNDVYFRVYGEGVIAGSSEMTDSYFSKTTDLFTIDVNKQEITLDFKGKKLKKKFSNPIQGVEDMMRKFQEMRPRYFSFYIKRPLDTNKRRQTDEEALSKIKTMFSKYKAKGNGSLAGINNAEWFSSYTIKGNAWTKVEIVTEDGKYADKLSSFLKDFDTKGKPDIYPLPPMERTSGYRHID